MINWLAGKIWFWKFEGMPCLNGINIYHPTDRSSKGFIIKLGSMHFKCRYSKYIRKWFIKAYWQTPGSYTTLSI